jgi:hypothetical protein
MIERTLVKEGKDPNTYRALNTRWGNLEDVDRLFQGGSGQVEGRAGAGTLSAASIEGGAAKGPQLGSRTDQAAELRSNLALKNPNEGEHAASNSLIGTAGNWIRQGTAPVIYAADQIGQRALNNPLVQKIPGVNALVEALRRPTMAQPRQEYKESRNAP